jgi:DNA repair exonuclease SbcCD ATPase subunit
MEKLIEEYAKISNELESLRQDKTKIETGNLNIKQYKERVDEIIKVIKEKKGLLTEFDDKIFNALIDRIEVLESTHFVFMLEIRRVSKYIVPNARLRNS